jgi:hypothetical protein
MKDPIIAEVRKYRMEHTQKFHANIHEICNDLKKFENKLRNIGCISKNNKFVSKNFNKELLFSEKQK